MSRISSFLLLVSMLPLLLGICLDFFLVATMVLENWWLAGILAGMLMLVFVALWFVLPRWNGK